MSPRRYERYCLVRECLNTSSSAPGKKFFCVPTDHRRRLMWLQAVERDPSTLSPKSTTYVCQDHFDLEEDIVNFIRYKYYGNERAILKRDVVPHIFQGQDRKTVEVPPPSEQMGDEVGEGVEALLHTSSGSYVVTPTKAYRNEASESKDDCDGHRDVSHNVGSTDGFGSTELLTPRKYRSALDLIHFSRGFKNVGVQTTFIPKLDKAIACSPKVSNFAANCKLCCGPQAKIRKVDENSSPPRSASPLSDPFVPSSPTSSTCSSSLSQETKCDESLKSESLTVNRRINLFDPLFFFGVPKSQISIISQLAECVKTSDTNVMLCLRKIRLNETFKQIGYCYGMSESNASRIFARYIPPIAKCMSAVVKWPAPSKIKERLPIYFRARFSEVQCIIDCFEVEIEKPSDPILQTLTWSEYKKANTLKFLLACTPDTLVSYISNGFGGRTSDSQITQKSTFLNFLPRGCHVMADRGFKGIAHHLSMRSCALVRPPSVSLGTKSTRKEVNLTKQIASLRVHVERVIGKLREFSILKPHTCVDHHLIKFLDHVTVIACGLINLQEPISKLFI